MSLVPLSSGRQDIQQEALSFPEFLQKVESQGGPLQGYQRTHSGYPVWPPTLALQPAKTILPLWLYYLFLILERCQDYFKDLDSGQPTSWAKLPSPPTMPLCPQGSVAVTLPSPELSALPFLSLSCCFISPYAYILTSTSLACLAHSL